jgi:hypothetical protein
VTGTPASVQLYNGGGLPHFAENTRSVTLP